jgi:uncharacterized membrane protein
MRIIEKSIEVDVPVTTAYNQWTQFETFPQFMEGVKEVQQLDDTHLHWVTEVGGKTKEYQAEITEQVPDQRIAWRSTEGASNSGVVTFHHLAPGRSRVSFQLGYEPEGMMEEAGDALGIMDNQVTSDLMRFKEFIEERGDETGAWRGEVHR